MASKRKASKQPGRKVVATKAGTNRTSMAERKRLFVEAMIQTSGNKRQSAIAAGYSDGRAADKAGERLSQDVAVQEAIQLRRSEVLAAAQDESEVTVKEVLRGLARDLRFDPKKLYGDDGKMKGVHELDEDTRRALRGWKINAAGFPEFKYPEQTSVREQAMKHLGMFERDNGQKAAPTVMVGNLTVALSFDKVRARSRLLKHA